MKQPPFPTAVRASGGTARRARRRGVAAPRRGLRERPEPRLRPPSGRGRRSPRFEPDLAALAGHDRVGANCFAGSGAGWKTRMFIPSFGVAEDPATGSAAGPLAVHLGRHGVVPWGTEIEIRQGAEIGRPSVLHARDARSGQGGGRGEGCHRRAGALPGGRDVRLGDIRRAREPETAADPRVAQGPGGAVPATARR